MQKNSFTEEKFKHWIESKPDEEVIGKSGLSRCCPIANFLKEVGYYPVIVSQDYWYGKSKEEDIGNTKLLPKWAWKIVAFVDTKEEYDTVSAKELKNYFLQNPAKQ